MLQQIIQLITILFLLSMVCERIADFLKYYMSDSHVFKIQKDFFKVGDTLTKFPNDELKEKERVFRILKINVWSGILLAAILKADFIKIFNNITEPTKALGWNNLDNYQTFVDWGLLPFGIVLTGLFISFGSKFWHDLLDLLYQIKNTKRVLSDPETYKVDNTKSLQKIFNTYQSDFIKAAYLEAQTKYMAMDNVKAIGIKSNDLGFYFEITIDKNNPDIEPFYQYLLDDRTPQNIPIKIVVLAEGDSIKALSFNLSAKVFNMNNPPSYGTIGFVVKKQNDQTDKKYLLTCCHNVLETFGVIDKSSLHTEDVGVSNSIFETKIGTVYNAFIDHEVDAALIEITSENENLILNSVPQMADVNDYRTLKRKDEKNVETWIFGARTYGEMDKTSEGMVNSLYNTVEITYEKYGNKKITMMNLIQISNKALPGDSGSCVVDRSCKLLGLVVAGSDEVTYVMPVKTLLMKLNLQIA